MVLALSGALALLCSAAAPVQAQGLSIRTPPQSARIYARDGSLIAELGPQVRTNVPLRSLPSYVPAAFVAVEDRRFYEHAGVDPVGIARAVRKTLEGDREGASTITQQLIGTMYPERVDRREMTAERKLREMRLAVELEQRYGKVRILESYLNWIYFGHGWFGIESAARHYFGKPAARLNIEETAMLAALPKGAGIYSPKIDPARALQRRNLVLGIMADAGVISASDAAAARRRPIRLAPGHGYSARPPWVIEQVRQFLVERHGPSFGTLGLRVWTTVDPAAQNAADSSLVRGLARVERFGWFRGPRYGASAKPTASGTPYLQGAIVSVDARTGEIIAMTGGRDWADSHFNRVTVARRQPGSAFKPIVYAAAVERGISPATVMQDTALHIAMPTGEIYSPQNSDDHFRGEVTVREGLVRSINTVAIQLGMLVGLDKVVAAAKRFGIASPLRPYPSTLIGAGEVRPLEMAGAYTTFANAGVRVDPFLIRRVSDARGAVLYDHRPKGYRILSPGVAFLMVDLMREAAERGTGTEARARLPAGIPMGGKTGTTDEGMDLWYVGFTPEVVTAVWVGFDTPRSLGAGAYGGAVAAPIWGEMMRDFYAGRPIPAPWPLPENAMNAPVDSIILDLPSPDTLFPEPADILPPSPRSSPFRPREF